VYLRKFLTVYSYKADSQDLLYTLAYVLSTCYSHWCWRGYKSSYRYIFVWFLHSQPHKELSGPWAI